MKKKKKKRGNEIKFGMTSISLRHTLLGITLWCMCCWVLPFEKILLLGKFVSYVNKSTM